MTSTDINICMKTLLNGYISETELIKAAQRGDLEVFNLLILSYQNLLFGIALGLMNDEDAAADAVPGALISAFRNFATFRCPGASVQKSEQKGTISIKCYPMRLGLFPGLPIMRGLANTHKFCPFFVGDRINDRRRRSRNFDLSKKVGLYQFLNQHPLPKRGETHGC